ncbi:MAG: hypothetical protein ABIN58_12565 [candidate division WOR-3 bacterium]
MATVIGSDDSGGALERLRSYQAQSAATQSRRQASLRIDDTVVKRPGSVLSYVWCWYSGQAKRVVKGQDLVRIVLRIGGEIIPLRLVWVSKQGRGSTSQPEVVLGAMAEVKEWFPQQGIDLTTFGMSFYSWRVSEGFSRALADWDSLNKLSVGRGIWCWRRSRAGSRCGRTGRSRPGGGMRAHDPCPTSAGRQSHVRAAGGDFLPAPADESLCAVVSRTAVAHV